MVLASRRKALKHLALSLGLACAPRWALAQQSALAAQSAMDLGLTAQDKLAAGQTGAALDLLQQAVAMEPDNGWLWGLMGRALLMAGQRDLARQALLRAADLDPTDALSRFMAERLDPDASVIPGSLDMAELERLARQEREELARSGQGLEQGEGFRVRRVVLDPGHGGMDPGAVGPSGLREKDVTLDLALRARDRLARSAPGLAVFLTRDQDEFLPLASRTAAANQFGADLFVSLHVNAAERAGANGVETYYCSETASSTEAERVARAENAALDLERAEAPRIIGVEEIMFRFERRRYWQAGAQAAAAVQGTLAPRLSAMDDRGVHCADFFVLRKARMPALLLETGFISNPGEEARLMNASRRDEIARAVAGSVAALAGEVA